MASPAASPADPSVGRFPSYVGHRLDWPMAETFGGEPWVIRKQKPHENSEFFDFIPKICKTNLAYINKTVNYYLVSKE